jgi:hypothetical protein
VVPFDHRCDQRGVGQRAVGGQAHHVARREQVERGDETIEHVVFRAAHHRPSRRLRDVGDGVVTFFGARRDNQLVDRERIETVEKESQHRAAADVLQHLARQAARTGSRLHHAERFPPGARDLVRHVS